MHGYSILYRITELRRKMLDVTSTFYFKNSTNGNEGLIDGGKRSTDIEL